MQELEQKKEIIREILLKYRGSVSGYEKLQRELWTSSLEQLQKIQAAYFTYPVRQPLRTS